MRKKSLRIRIGLLVLFFLGGAGAIWYHSSVEPMFAEVQVPFVATAQQVEQGAYLARAGNCAACHTARGGAVYAGGTAIATPFGTVYSSNLTPDVATGLGNWSPADFWHAMHQGRSRDGHWLYPAFPYTSYTLIRREDSDALFAYLRTLAPVTQPNQAHALAFPWRSQAALAVWRALFFKAASFEPDPARTPQWNRGAYLVQGLGHCAACHAPRNLLGATHEANALRGGVIPMQHWYAPSLADTQEAGIRADDIAQTVQLLKTGMAAGRSAMGPMAEVVVRSTQHLGDADLQAMAVYLTSLAAASPPAPVLRPTDRPTPSAAGEKIYTRHCAQCHGEQGEGSPGAYAPLAGNRAITMGHSANLVQAVLNGGFPPATAGNPRPYGMPPFRQTLDDGEVAEVLSYIRQAWGNAAPAVSVLEVMQHQ